jgi:magnesium-transporting ATPase (P-type)
MLTGDAKETAVAIAQQVGLYGPQGVPIRNSAISGEEIGKCFFQCSGSMTFWCGSMPLTNESGSCYFRH